MFESTNVLILVDVLTHTVVPIAAVAIAAILLQLVVLICATSPSPRDRSHGNRTIIAGLLFLGFGVFAGAPALRAQTETAGEIPRVEARYTRVFGSDTVEIVWQELSPDSRWIAYSSFKGAERTDGIWLVSTDGGDPIQLTTGKWDIHASWYPTSDRIAYRSTRGDDEMIMAVSIDPETGRAAGTPQRITLEAGAFPRVSPDGEWIAYRTFSQEGMALKIVPAQGGSSRTLVDLPGTPSMQSWSMDSRSVYFYWRGAGAEDGETGFMRVSIDGGDPEKITAIPTGTSAPQNPYFIYRGEGTDASGGPLHVIATIDGRKLSRVSLPKRVGELGHSKRIMPDGRHVVAVVRNTVTPLRVLPVAGGTGRQLGDTRADDVPIGWTPDGKRVVFQTVVDGRVAVLVAPVDEGAAEEYTVIPDLHMSTYQRPVLLSGDGRYVAFNKRTAASKGSPLVIARVSDGEIRTVSDARTNLSLFRISGPGGPATMGDEFLYLEASGKTTELRAASFDGGSHLIRAFPVVDRRVAGVFGSRIVWAERSGDSTEVMIADGPDAQPRRLVTVKAGFEDLVWSPDGRWIAGGAYFGNAEDYSFKIMLLGVNEAGEVVSPARFLDTQIGVGWGIRWLPDSQGLTVFAQSLPSYRTDIWLFSLRDGESPVALTRDETSEFWYYSLSPDGRYVAYPAAVPRGSSLWMVELEDTPTGD